MSPPFVSFERVDIVFGRKPELALPLMEAGQSREEIQSATDQVLGVHDCTLEVQEGEIVVLMGLSGSGKSTLLRAVNGLNRVTRGAVWVYDGTALVDVAQADAKTLRHLRTRRIAMVFQQFALLPWRTVADNIGLGLELAGVPAAERQERVKQQLALVKLDNWGERQVHELSGGMQQRVGLARAFATEAPILLMDEPFSALDPLIRNRLQDELLELQAGLGRTIIFVSHDLDEALKIGSKIAIMEGGRIAQFGTPQDIVLSPVNDYVADFVAHMNPLKVLRAAEVMKPFAGELPADEKAVRLGEADPSKGMDAIAAPDTPLTDLMRARRATGRPVLVANGGRAVGIVGDDEIYDCLLKY